MYSIIERICSLPESFFSTSSRMVLSALFSLLFVLLLGRPYIRLLWRFKLGQPIREGKDYYAKLEELHKEKKNTPTMGGILFLGATLFSTVLWANWHSLFVPLLMASLLVFTTIGALDDWAKLKKKSASGVSGRTRFLVQTAWSALLILVSLFPESFGFSLPKLSMNGESISWDVWSQTMFVPLLGQVACTSLIGWILFRVVEWGCLVGTPNAVNLSDGLDGLASGLAVFVSMTLAFVAFSTNHMELASRYHLAYVESSGEIAVVLSALTGALLGFLWFNSHPAEIFMGDTGSLGIGSILGTTAFLLHQEWFLFLVGILFVAEAVSVILQVGSFKLFKKRIFRCTPIHHHFEYAGIHEMKVVIRFWIIGLLAAVVSLLTLVL